MPKIKFDVKQMTQIKKKHKLLGVQVLGHGAMNKMIDIGVTAITLGVTLEQLKNMNLAYGILSLLQSI